MKNFRCILIAGLLLSSACSKGPVAINYGHDGCEFCKMTIVDARYGSELVTDKGKVYKFDAIECMINFINSENFKEPKLLVTDFTEPGKFIDAEGAYYLRSKNLPSPMGMYLTAFQDIKKAESFKVKHSGSIYNWEELNKEFNRLPALHAVL